MSQVAKRRPRTWVLWVVRAVLAATVLDLVTGVISTFWLGPRTGSFWWLIEAMPQVSIVLLAILVCWAPDSRPEGLGINVGVLLMFGMVAAVILLKWLPLVIGALAILALFVRPKGKLFILESPPTTGGPPL